MSAYKDIKSKCTELKAVGFTNSSMVMSTNHASVTLYGDHVFDINDPFDVARIVAIIRATFNDYKHGIEEIKPNKIKVRLVL